MHGRNVAMTIGTALLVVAVGMTGRTPSHL